MVTNLTYDKNMLTGWGKRNFNWEFSAGVQRELVPRVSADLTYFRRWHGNFVLVDDLAVGPADFDQFTITAPKDPRLPDGGGYPVVGYDIKPAKFGVAAQPFVTLSRKYGKQQDYWDGVDATVNARPREGLFFQGGVSTGRRVEDNCDVVAKVDNPNPLYCHRDEPFLTFVKGYGSYTIPRVDVQVSGTYQTKPGPLVLAIYTATNADVAPSLGRSLAGAAPSVDRPPAVAGSVHHHERRFRAGSRRAAAPGRLPHLEAARISAAPARARTWTSTTRSTRARCWCRTTPSATGSGRPRS